MTDLIGTIAAILTTCSFFPQLIQVIRTKNTRDLSLFMYIAFVLGVLSWLIYGFLINSYPIIAANAVTLACAAIILFYKIKFG